MTAVREGDGDPLTDPGVGDAPARQAGGSARKPKADGSARVSPRNPPDDPERAAARQAKVIRRRYQAKQSAVVPVQVPEPTAVLTSAQMREARKAIREQQAVVRKEREFGRRLIITLTEGQNALNIAFGAILSAYIGNVLAAIDDKPFNQLTLALFFVLIGVFIGGLCIGNLVVLRKHFGLGLGFLVTGAVAAALSLQAARALGFELPILKVMYTCWYAMLVVTDALLTGIIFFHHQSVVRRERQAAQSAKRV